MPPRVPDPVGVDASGKNPSSHVRPGIAKRRFILAGKLLLAGLMLWLLVRLELLDYSPLRMLLDSWWLLPVTCLVLWPAWPLVAWRWHLLLHAQNVSPRFLDVFRVSYSSAFLGLYLPGTVGTDVARIALGLSLPRSHVTLLALSVVVDRIVGIVGLMLVGLLASIAYLAYLDSGVAGYGEVRMFVLILGAAFAGVAVTLVLGALLAQRLKKFSETARWHERGFLLRMAARAIEASRLYGETPRTLLAALAISIVVHSLAFAVLALLAWKIGGGDASPWKYAIAGAITAIVNSLSITPGGIGIGELSFAQILLWLEPAAKPVPYATVFLTHRVLLALTLLPALAVMPNPLRRTAG